MSSLVLIAIAATLADFEVKSARARERGELRSLVGVIADTDLNRLEQLYDSNPNALLLLSSLSKLGAADAKVLAGSKAQLLVLNGLTALDAPTAAALATWPGQSLLLNGLKSISRDAVAALVKWKGRWLFLHGIATLDAGAAKQLAKFDGLMLGLRGLANVDPGVAKELAAFKGSVEIKPGDGSLRRRPATDADRDTLINVKRAIERGDTATVKQYLDAGGEPDFGENGNTLLMEAAMLGRPAVVKALLAAKANPSAVNHTSETSLTFAIDRYGPKVDPKTRYEIVELLLKAGANVNPEKTDRDDKLMWKTPLMHAVESGDEAMISLLLTHGADPNATAHNGYTALETALTMRNAGALRLLIAKGAKPTGKHATLWWVAEMSFEIETYKSTAKSEGVEPDPVELKKLRAKWTGMLDALKAAGAGMDSVDEYGGGVLEAAISAGDEVVLEHVIQMGADPNNPAKNGRLPLHHLAAVLRVEKTRLVPLAKVMLQHGARKDAKDKAGKTAAEVAAERNAPALAALLKP